MYHTLSTRPKPHCRWWVEKYKQDMCLASLARVARKAALWGFMRLEQSERQFWQVTAPRALHREQTETRNQAIHDKGQLTCSRASTWRTGFRLAIHLKGQEKLPGNVDREMPLLCSSLALPEFTGTFQKGAYTPKPQFLHLLPRRYLQISWSTSQLSYGCSSTWLCLITYFKVTAWVADSQSAWN